MRTSPFAIANLAVIVAIAGSTLVAVGSGRHTDFTAQTKQLEQRWTEMSSEGVAPSALAPLENGAVRRRHTRRPGGRRHGGTTPAPRSSPGLEAGTDAVWNQAMSTARTRATAALLGWDLMVERNAAVLTSATVAMSTTWVIARRRSDTHRPSIDTLSADIVSADGERADRSARRRGIEHHRPSHAACVRCSSNRIRPEQRTSPDPQPSSRRTSASQPRSPRSLSTAALATLSAQVSTLDATVTATLKKDACGHDVPSGKAIVINLTLQEALFYQNGCVLEATPVTSGRRDERTPNGTFHVFHKDSPVLFTSWAPRSSPYWYPPERANYALEFTVVRAGIFLHDAPWEPNTAFGPGSQNTDNASHGCVHAPTSVMAWAYSWANIGTPVIVVD